MDTADKAHDAFKAITAEVEALLKHEMPENIRDGLKRIQSLARYEFNLRPLGGAQRK